MFFTVVMLTSLCKAVSHIGCKPCSAMLDCMIPSRLAGTVSSQPAMPHITSPEALLLNLDLVSEVLSVCA